MGVRNASSASSTVLNASIANGVEGALVTTGLIGLAQDNAQVLIVCFVNCTVGVGATACTFRIRRGNGITGTTVNVAGGPNVSASTTIGYVISYSDSPGVVGSAQYTFTGAVTGGAAALTIVDASIMAFVL